MTLADRKLASAERGSETLEGRNRFERASEFF
jgi:hypothetical protein